MSGTARAITPTTVVAAAFAALCAGIFVAVDHVALAGTTAFASLNRLAFRFPTAVAITFSLNRASTPTAAFRDASVFREFTRFNAAAMSAHALFARAVTAEVFFPAFVYGRTPNSAMTRTVVAAVTGTMTRTVARTAAADNSADDVDDVIHSAGRIRR